MEDFVCAFLSRTNLGKIIQSRWAALLHNCMEVMRGFLVIISFCALFTPYWEFNNGKHSSPWSAHQAWSLPPILAGTLCSVSSEHNCAAAWFGIFVVTVAVAVSWSARLPFHPFHFSAARLEPGAVMCPDLDRMAAVMGIFPFACCGIMLFWRNCQNVQCRGCFGLSDCPSFEQGSKKKCPNQTLSNYIVKKK